MHMVELSQRAQSIKPSATLAIAAKAKQMKAAGIDVIGFGLGEPDFATPAHIVGAAVAALEAGDTHYTPVGGTPELRKAIVDSIQRDYGLTYAPAQATASCGAKHTLYNLFMALLNPGDECLIPAPYWVSYPEQVAMTDAYSTILPTREEDGFLLHADTLEKAIGPKTKALVLNSPSNPTGGMYSRESLGQLAEVIRKHEVVVISDDIYQKLVYDGKKFISLLEVAPDLADRVVIVNGVSKSYAMTGWRLGYAVGPKHLMDAMENIQSQSTSNPTSFVQKATVEALMGDQSCVTDMCRIFERRRNLLVEGLNRLPGVTCRMPDGAFYAFPNMTGLYGTKTPAGAVVANSLDITAYLLEEARVAVVPGEPFGADANIRLSYATSEAHISEGLARMDAALKKLSR
jgi:aspartate aminotransferase